ncbi:MAG: FkbM family methyltransferase [Cytophagaceae bacterium]|nr:MAG: FkbM family methyltransferase [Cytophagaceae bacterium]
MSKLIDILRLVKNELLPPQKTEKDKELFRLQNLSRYTETNTTVLGNILRLPDTASFLFIYDEVFKKEIYRFKSDKQNPYIIDCGANIGLSAQYFARRFPRAKIIGVEPDTSNFSAAERHSAKFPQITIHNAAIGSQPGFVQIANEGVDANAFQVVRTDTDGGVPVKTIPEIFTEIDDAELFIVKIDIEGFERDLFAENTDWIAYCDILIVELHDWMLPGQASSLPFIKAIAAHQRDFLFKGESVFSFRNDHLSQG